MKLYRLNISPDESDGEGEDHDEWFTSLHEAEARRQELIDNTAADGYRYGSDFEIERVTFRWPLTVERLLNLLNRKGWAQTRETVVDAYKPPEGEEGKREEAARRFVAQTRSTRS